MPNALRKIVFKRLIYYIKMFCGPRRWYFPVAFVESPSISPTTSHDRVFFEQKLGEKIDVSIFCDYLEPECFPLATVPVQAICFVFKVAIRHKFK